MFTSQFNTEFKALKALFTALLITAFAVTTAQAANVNRTWTGDNGNPGNWSEVGNWNSLPDSGDNLYFYDSLQPLTTNDRGDDFSVRKIEIEPTASAYTFAGDRIALSGTGILNDSSNLQTFDLGISLSGIITTIDANSNMIFNGEFSGTGGLELSGTAEITLNALNSFTGHFRVEEGTVNVDTIKNNTSPSAVGQGSRIVLGLGSTTGTLNYTGTGDTWSRNMKIGENTAGANDTGGGRINNNGTGALVITDDQSFTANGNVTAERTLTFGGANTDDNEMQMPIIDNSTINGGIVTVEKADSGKWILSGANAYTGATSVTGGTLVVTGSIANSSGVTVTSGATLAGDGALPIISGAGSVDPGASPGVMTATQVDPVAGLDFNFEVTGESMIWAPVTNDVLRLTDGTTAFTSPLTSANEINLYLDAATAAGLIKDAVIEAGFYTDTGDHLGNISSATLNVFSEDAGGGITYNGVQYSPMAFASTFVIGTTPDGEFDAGGYITTFTYAIPEPSTLAIVALPLIGLLKRRREEGRS